MLVYENVFHKNGKIYVREYDTETKEVFFSKQTLEIPFFYKDNKNGLYKAYRPYKNDMKLSRKDLEYNEYLDEKKLAKNANLMLYGRDNLAFEWIFQHYPKPISCVHDFHTWFIDIEVSGKIDNGAKANLAWKPEYAQQEVTLIQVYDSLLKCFLVWSLKEYTGDLDKDIVFFMCSNEKQLLKSFINEMKTRKPAMLVGWNTHLYDYPYLTNRISRVLDNNENIQSEEEVARGFYVSELSPFGIVERYHGDELEYLWKGIILEDYLHIYKKYTFHTLDSYSLNSVCSYELGKEKISHDEYTNFVEFYNNDFNKFFEYGVKDVELLVELDKKLKLLDLCSFISYMCGVCIPDIRGTLKQWNNYVYNEAFKRAIILPAKSLFKKADVKFIGGIVHSTTNTWDWVASFDFTSLYPSLISWMNLGGDTLYIPKDDETDLLEIQSKMLEFSPDATTEEVKAHIIDFTKRMFFGDDSEIKHIRSVLEKHNLCMAANGSLFTKSKKSLFATLIEDLLVERQRLKKEMKKVEAEIEELKAQGLDYDEKKKQQEYFETNQVALKVLANSAYGILSMEACSFTGSNKHFSNAVTSSGQVFDVFIGLTLGSIIEKVNNSLEQKHKVKDKGIDGLPWITAADTDSCYVSVAPFVRLLESKGITELQDKLTHIDNFINAKIFPKLREAMDYKVSEAFNALMPEKMNLDREIIADKFLSIGNKCYYTRIYDSEGVKLTKPKLKIVGLAVKKSNTPLFFRDRVLKAMELLLDENYSEIERLEKLHKEEMYQASPDELSSNVNVNSIEYEFEKETGKLYSYTKGKKLPAPIHSRGAIFHNLYVTRNDLNIKLIENGDKCKMIPLKLPNPTGSDVFTYINPNIFTDELKSYIDYNALFEKYYIGVLNLVRVPLNLFDNGLDLDEW